MPMVLRQNLRDAFLNKAVNVNSHGLYRAILISTFIEKLKLKYVRLVFLNRWHHIDIHNKCFLWLAFPLIAVSYP